LCNRRGWYRHSHQTPTPDHEDREFDFDDVLGIATISSATVTAKIVSTGVDVTATLTTVAKQDITTDTSSCFVWCIGLTDGVDYQITCKIVASDGTKHELEGLIYVGAIPATASTGTGPGLVVAPIIEPVSLAEAKLQCRVDGTDEDELFTVLIQAAREIVEDETRRALLTQTWDYVLQSWPRSNYIKLPYGNLQSVTSIKWKDTDGTETTLVVTTDYLAETNGPKCGRVVLPYGGTWPTGSLYPSNPIKVRFVCGWTSAMLVPNKTKQAILMIINDLYANRSQREVLASGQKYELNPTMQLLLWNEKLWEEL